MRKFILFIAVVLTGWVLYLLFSQSFQATPTPESNPSEEPAPSQPEESADNTPEDPAKHVSEQGLEIFVEQPLPDEGVTSPMAISGRAPGTWFFEASAPVVLTNWDGVIIAEGFVTAPVWMTTEYVPFSGTLTFTKPVYGEEGFLILRKDNPSGLPGHDDSIELRVKFE